MLDLRRISRNLTARFLLIYLAMQRAHGTAPCTIASFDVSPDPEPFETDTVPGWCDCRWQ